MNWINFELRLLWQNHLLKGLLLAYVLLALVALHIGQASVEREYQQIALTQAHNQAEIADYRQQGVDTSQLGYMNYYVFYPVWQTPSPWSALFQGERQETATHLRVRLLGLQTQLNTTASGNLSAMPFGQLDLAFILIFIMPLLIAATSLNLLAEEKSSGRWPMIASQLRSPAMLLFNKLLLSAGVLALVHLLILIAAVIMTDVTFGAVWARVFVFILAYQLCWFVINAWIISLQRSAIFNSLIFISVWIGFAFVVPGLAYMVQTQQQTPSGHIAMVFDQRQYMHDSWDRDKVADFEQYLEDYPQWQQTTPLSPTERFDWRWYFAMQHMSEVVVSDTVEDFRTQRIASHQLGEYFAWLSPVMQMQKSVNRIADTDMRANQAFLDQIQQYYQSLQEFYFPFLFFDQTFTDSDFERIPEFDYQPLASDYFARTLFSLSLIAGLFGWGLWRQLRRKTDTV